MTIQLTKLTTILSISLAFSTNLHAQSNSLSASVNNLSSNQPQLTANVAKAIFPNNGWKSYPALPAAKWAQASAFVKNCTGSLSQGALFIFSGYDAAFANSTSSYKFDLATNTWSLIANFPSSRGQFGAATVKGKIYMPGGYATSFSPTATGYVYDPEYNTYSAIANLPYAVGDYAIAPYKDSLVYVIGGYNGSSDLNVVQIYNPTTNTWTSGTPYPGTAVAGVRCGITGNKIIMVGGYNQISSLTYSTAYQGIIDPNNPANITWSTIANYPGGGVVRHAGGASPFNDGMVYFTGGDPTGGGTATMNTTYAYNTNTNQWDSGPNKITSVSNVYNFVPFEHNDSLKFAVLGGYNGSIIVSNFDVLNIGPSPKLVLNSNDTSFCGSATITISASGAPNYNWSPSWEFADHTLPTQTITTDHTILAKVTYKPVWGCLQQDSVLISANPIPTVLIDSVETLCYLSSPFQLSGAPSGGTFTGNGVLNSTFMPAVAGVGSHIVSYTFTTPEGCSNTASTTIDLFDCLSNDEAEFSTIQIYPNPFENFITIEGIDNAKVNLINAVGQTLLTRNIVANGITLDLSILTSGIYFVTVDNGSAQNTYKIIKK